MPPPVGAKCHPSARNKLLTLAQKRQHAIAPNLDDERAFLFDSLKQTGALLQSSVVDGYHQVTTGKNGDGNEWRTDGRLFRRRLGFALERLNLTF